jgi:hypothetical protein
VTTLADDLLLSRGYVEGGWVEADSGESFEVTNPASGEVLATVPRMGAAETRRAIDAAARALPGWRAMLAKDRARIMRRWADLMMERSEELSALLTAEQGKPLAEARAFAAWLEGLRPHDWAVYAKPPFAGPRQVVSYLGRYTHRVAISNERLVALQPEAFVEVPAELAAEMAGRGAERRQEARSVRHQVT